MRRVLVTGAAGFAGHYLLEELSAGGISVVGTYYRTPPPRNERLRVEDWFHCDIRDSRAVHEVVALAKPDAIVHLAAMSIPIQANANPRAAYDTNVSGWLSVLEAVRRRGRPCRILLVSSSHVYGIGAVGSTGFHEDMRVQPYDTYGATRAASELISDVYGRQYGIQVVTARAFNHCGPRQRPDYFVATLAHQTARIAVGLEAPEIRVRNLDVVRDFTDVRDVVRAYAGLLRHGQAGQVYNVCSGAPMSLQAIMNLMQEISGSAFRAVTDSKRTAGLQPSTVFGDPRRLQQATGWSQSISLADTLRDTLQYWMEQLRGEVRAQTLVAADTV